MDGLPFVVFLDLGLFGFALLCFGEKFLPVMPSYVLLVLLGLMTVRDTAGLMGAVIASTVGSVIGAIGWYSLGRTIGRQRSDRFVERFGKFFLLRPTFYRRLVAAYARNPFLVTAIGQTVPMARIYLPLPAGVIGLSIAPFLLATTLGTLTWNTPLITIGYLLRRSGCSPTPGDLTVIGSIIVVTWFAMFGLAQTRGHYLRKQSS